jgi:hypothetical protein
MLPGCSMQLDPIVEVQSGVIGKVVGQLTAACSDWASVTQMLMGKNPEKMLDKRLQAQQPNHRPEPSSSNKRIRSRLRSTDPYSLGPNLHKACPLLTLADNYKISERDNRLRAD